MKLVPTPNDMYFFRKNLYTIKIAFSFLEPIKADVLRRALQNLEPDFPIIKARVHISDGRIELNCDGELPPIHTETLLSSFASSSHDRNSLFDPIENLPNQPLLKLRLSYFSDRTVLGVSFSHFLGDGFSFFMLVKALAQACREEKTCALPNFDRDALTALLDSPVRAITSSRVFDDTGYCLPRPTAAEGATTQKLTITDDEIATAKGADHALSDHCVVTAMLAKHLQSSIPISKSGHAIVRCPVDYRKKVPGLSPNYFGNAVRDAVLLLEPASVNKFSIAQLARAVHDSIRAVDIKTIARSLNCLRDLHVHFGENIFEHVGCEGLLVSNLSKLNFSALNFGCGEPIEIHHASLNPRLAVVLRKEHGYEIICNSHSKPH